MVLSFGRCFRENKAVYCWTRGEIEFSSPIRRSTRVIRVNFFFPKHQIGFYWSQSKWYDFLRVNGIATVCGCFDQSFGFGCFVFGGWVSLPISIWLVWLMRFNRTGKDIWWLVYLPRYVRFLHFTNFHRFYTAWCCFWHHRIRSKNGHIICNVEKTIIFWWYNDISLNDQ